MPVSMRDLTADLAAESAVLQAILADLEDADWKRDTPAAGWTVADQVTHLAYFDDVAIQSATDPEGFLDSRDKVAATGGIDPDTIAASYRELPAPDVLAWFDRSRARLVDVFAGLEPGLRVPWYGPAMSAASSLTARIMETWAHGQDIADSVGVQREPTDRLRHVAHIGVGARAYSYAVNERPMPEAPIRVELVAPDGSTWVWGPDGASDRVTGSALDFALAVTQRRHREDTALDIHGLAATDWMSIAQAFAGTAGSGRTRSRSAGESS